MTINPIMSRLGVLTPGRLPDMRALFVLLTGLLATHAAHAQSAPAGSKGGPAAAISEPSRTSPDSPRPGATTPAMPNITSPPTASSPAATSGQPGPQAAPSTPVSPASSMAATLPHDLSPWGMFMQADIVVKAVMLGLAFASLVTWTVWLAKGIELVFAKRGARKALRALAEADSLRLAEAAMADGAKRRGCVPLLVDIALREIGRSEDLSAEGVKERVAIALSRSEARAGRQMAVGTGVLATIGATAPFVGLFGTVWGIMNAFIGISQTKTTNLAVVAPGIAEALLATAIGLVAAIPAVIIYNVFARSIAQYRALLSDASGEVLQHLSRDLERDALARKVLDDYARPEGRHQAAPPRTVVRVVE